MINHTIVSVNLGNFGSTGTIAREIVSMAESAGFQAYAAYPGNRLNKPEQKGDIKISTWPVRKISEMLANLTGMSDCFAYSATWKLTRFIDELSAVLLHLHNLHGSYINIPLFFLFIKSHHIPVIWTLHDCWAFTGHCPHFTMEKCNKWVTGCYACKKYRDYPRSFADNSKMMWKLKKKWFTGVEDLTIVTPSQWLADLVKQSFLKDYPVRVIHNGIDLTVFKPTESIFREKYGIPENKFILLGVAFGWGKRKGLDVFTELSMRLDLEKYQIVLVGTDDMVDKQLPDSIVSIHRTQNQKELAEIYSAADLFVNPTREEVLGLVNIEALACGTPGVTFNTGGSPECYDETCGSVVECDDIDSLEKEIIRICEEKPYSKEACLKRAESFDANERYKEYIELYKECLS